jgi:hypothetical protein
MNRILSILLTLFILFLIYVWISRVVNTKQEESLTSSTKAKVLDASEISELEQEYKLSTIEEKDPIDANLNDSPVESESEKQQVQSKESETDAALSGQISDARSASSNVNISKHSDAGKHLVIAGNFLQLSNAEERLDELRNFGYTSAEIINFDLSEYHTVCAARFKDINEARRTAKKIQDYHSIDAYVRPGS